MVRENCLLSFLFEIARCDVGLCMSSNAIVVNVRVTISVKWLLCVSGIVSRLMLPLTYMKTTSNTGITVLSTTEICFVSEAIHVEIIVIVGLA